MKYQPYPAYRDSGVEWLGDIPEHWEVKRIKHLGAIRYGLGEPPEYVDEGLPFIRATDIKEGKIDLEKVKKVSPDDVPWNRKPRLELDEILIVRSGAYTGDSAIVTSAVCGCIVGYDMVLTVKKGHARFVAWVLLSKYMLQGQIYLERLRAAQPHLNAEELGGFVVLVPDYPEQHAIADFLDFKTATLDTLVAKKRALVERLKEKRTALISRTVTRGLPPEAASAVGLDLHPKLKLSGIEWLGDVPENREIVALGYLVQLRGGATPDKTRSEFWDGTIPWVSPKDMKQMLIRDSEDHISEEALHNSPLSLFPPGIILIVVRGMILAHSFPVALSQSPLTINQDMKALICGRRLVARFLCWTLTGFAKVLVALTDESAHGTRKLETLVLKHFPIPVPPLAEQHAIADYLDRETAKIDRLIEKVQTAIEKLQEYRTALITAAVTGKIDVRGLTLPGGRQEV